jgi:hypothetical protein
MSGNQRFVCGMRRFDKHRMNSSSGSSVSSPVFQKEIQERLQAREEQDRLLYSSVPSVPSVPSVSSVSSVSSTVCYTPWKTPSTPSR